MSIIQDISFVCDGCDTHHMVKDDAEMPPHWLGLQIAIANEDGLISSQERDIYKHFCSIECMITYVCGEEIKERLSFVDRKNLDNEPSEDDNYESEEDL